MMIFRKIIKTTINQEDSASILRIGNMKALQQFTFLILLKKSGFFRFVRGIW